MNYHSDYRTTLPRPTDRLQIADTQLMVSPFCLGMVTEPDTVLTAYDAGINFFFVSADLHWSMYEALREGIRLLLNRGGDIREKVVVAVVSYITQTEFCARNLDEVLDAIPNLERIDVAIAGGCYKNEYKDRLPVYATLKQQARYGIQAIGGSFHQRKTALEAICEEQVDMALIRYNPGHCGAKNEIFPHLPSERKSLLYNFKSTNSYIPPFRFAELGLGSDYWQPAFTDYYRFALSHASIDGILCSPQTPKEVLALSRAMEEAPLDEEERDYMIALSAMDRQQTT